MRCYEGHSVMSKSKSIASAEVSLVDPILFENGEVCFEGYAKGLAVLRSSWPFSCSASQDQRHGNWASL